MVEINTACDDARRRGLKQLGPAHQRAFAARYDHLVARGLAVNHEPAHGRKRDYYQRRSFNLATAFATHRQPSCATCTTWTSAFPTTRPSKTSDR